MTSTLASSSVLPYDCVKAPMRVVEAALANLPWMRSRRALR
jgi:hypothetical protein